MIRDPGFALVAASVMVASCATGTGIMQAGPDTYTVTETVAPIRGGSTVAEQTAMSEATRFCAQQNKQLFRVSGTVPVSANPYGPTGFSLTFRCLAPGQAPPPAAAEAAPLVSQKCLEGHSLMDCTVRERMILNYVSPGFAR